jgi:hypothetical protein
VADGRQSRRSSVAVSRVRYSLRVQKGHCKRLVHLCRSECLKFGRDHATGVGRQTATRSSSRASTARFRVQGSTSSTRMARVSGRSRYRLTAGHSPSLHAGHPTGRRSSSHSSLRRPPEPVTKASPQRTPMEAASCRSQAEAEATTSRTGDRTHRQPSGSPDRLRARRCGPPAWPPIAQRGAAKPQIKGPRCALRWRWAAITAAETVPRAISAPTRGTQR